MRRYRCQTCVRNTPTRALVNGPVLSGRLSFEDFIALGELDPGLLPANPYVPRGPQPGRIVQRAAPDAHDTIPRHTAKSRSRTLGKPV